MVNSLSLSIQIKSGETIRDKDGLAKSSRNNLLSAKQRKKLLISILAYKNKDPIRQGRLYPIKRNDKR